MFQHENFGCQLLWALERGVIVDTEWPEELILIFNQPPPAAADKHNNNNNNKEGVGMMK